MVSNYLFPLPVPIHITFCVIGLIFFLVQYYRKKYIYHLLLAIAIPSTLLVYICTSDISFNILGFEEFILFILIVVSMILTKKHNTKKEQTKETEDEDSTT